MARLSAAEINRHIGARIRLARTLVSPRMSQTALGEAIGVSFQQVQKYEKGKDRIAAPTLVHLAEVTGQDIPFFFADALAACEAPAEQVAA